MALDYIATCRLMCTTNMINNQVVTLTMKILWNMKRQCLKLPIYLYIQAYNCGGEDKDVNVFALYAMLVAVDFFQEHSSDAFDYRSHPCRYCARIWHRIPSFCDLCLLFLLNPIGSFCC
jgi:hypothetical protein